MVTFDFRLFAPAVLSWAATAALLKFQSATLGVAMGSVVMLLFIWLIWIWRTRTSGVRSGVASALSTLTVTLSITLAFVSVIGMRIGFESQVRQSPALHAAARLGDEVRMRAVATSAPSASKLSQSTGFGANLQLNATLGSVQVSGRNVATSVPIRLMLTEQNARSLEIGSELTLTGKITPLPEGRSVAYVVRVAEITSQPPPTFLRWTNALRDRLRQAAAKLDGWGAELIPGLAVGDTQLVEPELDRAMKTASLSHLTAVSGANCAIIVGIFLYAGAALRLRTVFRVTVAALCLAAFVILVTPEPSVVRAGVMSLVSLLGMVSARKGAGLAALGVAIASLLILDPWQATHLGFVLSVLATAGILVFTDPIRRWLERFMPSWLALTFAVPLAAQFACQPAIILMQPTLPTFGVLANVLAAPAAPIATITGLVACLALPIWPWLGELFTWLTWWPAAWIAGVAKLSASLPAAQLPWIDGWFGAVLLAALSAAILIAFVGRKETATRARSGGWRWVIGALAVSILLAIAVVRPIATVASIPTNWRIFACDVGQGDGVLVRGNRGIALIDTGFDAQKISTCLDTLGIQKIDLLVLTHDDKDHVGGLPGVVGRVRAALIAPAVDATQLTRPIVEDLADNQIKTVIAHRGMRGSLGDVNWQVLWPTEGAKPPSSNDASVTVRIDAPELSAVFLGDLGEHAQREMMRAVQPQPVDVVKVSHHGSSDQFGELYQALRAKYGVISVGAENGYGHPTDSLLRMLKISGTTPLRTDLSGAFAIARDSGGEWKLWSATALG